MSEWKGWNKKINAPNSSSAFTFHTALLSTAFILQHKERCSRMDLTPEKFLMIQKLFGCAPASISPIRAKETNSKKLLPDVRAIFDNIHDQQ